MARLNDITLYDQFHPAEGQRQFQQRTNFVSGLYWQQLHSCKPARTARISITLVPEQRLARAWMVGSIAVIDQYAHAPTYDALPDSAKLHYLLDCLHAAGSRLCQVFQWDAAVFEQSYQQVRKFHLELQ